MLKYVLGRAFWVAIGLILLALVAFAMMELPRGSIINKPSRARASYYAGLTNEQWLEVEQSYTDYAERFALDKPFLLRYVAWVRSVVLDGNWGYSLEWQKQVSELIYERLWLTLGVVVPTVVLSWLMAIPLGAGLARHKSTLLDDLCTFACRVSRCIPPFIIALVVMWAAMTAYERNMGGLYSKEFILAPWSRAKVVDLLKHIWLPIGILFFGNAAQSTLVMRAAMLRELDQPYVDGVRIRGVAEKVLLRRYPLRVALGWFLGEERFVPARVLSAVSVVAMVLSLQMTGPMMLRAMTSQDGYLYASFLLVLGVFSLIGVTLVDVLRAALDPRLRTSAWQPGTDSVGR